MCWFCVCGDLEILCEKLLSGVIFPLAEEGLEPPTPRI